ncbi:PD-(D/E)XK nuclease family transposase [Robertmurraya andreesenii]|uniref:Transposase/invertase (TIGR01784 family) n=1 Tax=Anoxybacillus andreesenii TaxID=1325932 RepID=A0ABT9V8M8_9BACL|nr:PD-(D/E)XK nuclease family transposase [Robertmurraya andreesenii]MDQ0157311.1 putative transposase/invertase (TIGR01784 family) [Robertmurraya andreesenii]
MITTSIVYEETNYYIDHDRLFKELIKTFFQEFIEAFFPEEYGYIDFSQLTFLDKEIYTDIVMGEKREVDILVETKLKGKDTIVIVHIEPQSYFQHEFHERMFIYNSRLYEHHRKPILPIAVFSYPNKRDIPTQFTISFPTLKIHEFQYLQLHLIKKNWRAFIHNNNPAAAALLSKMGYAEEERIQVKLEFLRMLSKMELNPAKMELLYGFFETYLRLNEKEEERMREEITKLPEHEMNQVLKLPNSYFEKGIKQGIKEGIEQGKLIQGIEIAKKMLGKGIDVNSIREFTGLPKEMIEDIKKEMD